MRTTVLAAGFSVLALSTAAMADTVQMRYIGTDKTRTVTVAGVFNGTVHAGSLTHEFRNGNGEAAALAGQIATFCTELTQHVNSNWHTFNLGPTSNAPTSSGGMGEAKANMIARLYDVAAGQQYLTRNFAAAFQMMVWEIVYDYDPSVAGSLNLSRSNGNVRYTGGDQFAAVTTIFDSLRTSLIAGNGAGITNLRAVTHGSYQDQLVIIPLPAPAMLAAAGLFGVIGIRRRRN